jgi:hypothetical protein
MSFDGTSISTPDLDGRTSIPTDVKIKSEKGNQDKVHGYMYVCIYTDEEKRRRDTERTRQWRQNNRSRYNRYWQVWRAKLKIDVLRAYGGRIPRCKKCGICDIRFLTIDHPNNNGGRERKNLDRYGSSFYHWLRQNGFPTGYRVLCYYCNHTMRRISHG